MDCSQKEGWNGSEGVRETGRRRRGRVGRREREGERERERVDIRIHRDANLHREQELPSRVFFQRGYYGNRSYSWVKRKIERCGTRDG